MKENKIAEFSIFRDWYFWAMLGTLLSFLLTLYSIIFLTTSIVILFLGVQYGIIGFSLWLMMEEEENKRDI